MMLTIPSSQKWIYEYLLLAFVTVYAIFTGYKVINFVNIRKMASNYPDDLVNALVNSDGMYIFCTHTFFSYLFI